jgi:outer membrane protein OmpA-like peptidoglycan-associated protein
MEYLLSHFGLSLVAIFAIGAVTALMRRRTEADGGLSPWLAWGLLAFVVGLAVSGVAALQGRAGLWLDSGLAAYAAFLIGCAAGALYRGGHLREHREWALGLLPATLLWIGANALEIPKIEASREAGAEATANEAVEKPANPQTDPLAAARRAAFLESARRQAEKLARSRAALKTDAVDRAGGDQTGSVVPSVQSSAPQPRVARLEAARAYLAKLPAAGALELPACQQALEATQTVNKAPFPTGSAEITRAAADALDALTSILRRCPDATIEIAGHTDNIGDEASNQALSQRRAEAIRRYLMLKGVPAARLSATGYGSKQPIASNDDEAGRADNRRIEFVLK